MLSFSLPIFIPDSIPPVEAADASLLCCPGGMLSPGRGRLTWTFGLPAGSRLGDLSEELSELSLEAVIEMHLILERCLKSRDAADICLSSGQTPVAGTIAGQFPSFAQILTLPGLGQPVFTLWTQACTEEL